MAIPEVLGRLLTAAGPSGYEQAPAAVFRDAAAAFAEVTSRLGRLVGGARARHRRAGCRSRSSGHIDEIGLIVHHIDDDGFLWFTGVGGWDPIVLVGQRVSIATRSGPVPGVVGKKPIHLMKDDDRKKVPLLKDLHIDIGASGGDEARRAGPHRRRRGDRGRAGRVSRRPVRLALDGQPDRLLRGAGGGAAGGRGRRRARRCLRAGGDAGGDHVRGRADDRPTRCGRTWRSPST